MEDVEGRTFVEVMSEKYSPDNFPYRRGPGMGVVVVPMAGPQGSPMKGERDGGTGGRGGRHPASESTSDSSPPPQIV